MVGKLAIFAIGYVLGARAGRERYNDIVKLASWAAARDEVQMAANMALGVVQMGMERGGGVAFDMLKGAVGSVIGGVGARRAA
jgi:hypothetical protein